MLKVYFLSLFWVFPACLWSQNVLTLDQALEKALQKNYDLQSVSFDKKQAETEFSYGKYLYFPRLNLSILSNRVSQSIKQEFSNGTSLSNSGVGGGLYNATLNVNWLIYDGKRLNFSRKRLQSLAEQEQFLWESKILQTLAEVHQGFIEIIFQQEKLKVIEEQKALSEERFKISNRKTEVGLASHVDVLQAKIDLENQIITKENQEIIIQKSKINLNRLMGEGENKNYEINTHLSIDTTLRLDSLRAKITKNPSLLALQKIIEATKFSVAQAQAEHLPSVNLFSNYGFNRQQNEAGFSLVNQNIGLTVGLQATVPIFNNFNAKHQIEVQKITLDKNQKVMETYKFLAENQLVIIFLSYQNGLKLLPIQKKIIQLSEESMTIALERFKQGLSTTIEVRLAQNNVEQSKFQYFQTLYETKKNEIALKLVAGLKN